MRSVFKWVGIIVLIIALPILYARFISTSGLKVKEYKVVNENITMNYHGLKIVHLSDIHYGSTVFESELNQIVAKVNEINPDIVVFTGDLFTDNKSYDKDLIISYFSKISTKLGKFFVSGNHDNPIEDYIEIFEKSGFKNLDDNYELIYGENEPILISGISSNRDSNSDISVKTAKLDSFTSESTEKKYVYSILLMHEPDFVDKINLDNYDLVLSGHSHGGQVRLPLIGSLYTPKFAKNYHDEYYKINNTDLYISSGIGNSVLNLRFFNKPSFNFYRITNK